MAATLARGEVPLLQTFTSSAVRLCEAALESGVDIRGAQLVLVVGRKDFLVSPSALAHDQAALAARGINATLIRFDGGHALNSEVLRQLSAR